VTTDEVIGRRSEGSVGSVRQRVAAIPQAHRVLLGILALAVIVHGWRALLPFYIRGDLLYHWGLTHTILLGSFPPEGPYAGLPAYYPPGFHLILAGLARLPGFDVESATMALGILWLPVIPLGAYLLARRVTGRTDVALIAAALTAFAGGFDVSIDRLWVNSLSMGGQVAYPVYPRDLVFGLLPFAMLAYLRAVDGGRRWPAWAGLAGLLLGLCGLIQVQLLLPIPFALAAFTLVVAWRDHSRWRVAVGAFVATGLIALALVTPWLLFIAGTIARNGGVSIESSEDLLPVRIGFWNYPIQFGIVLPLAIAGAGLVLLFLRRTDRSHPGDRLDRWAPRAAEGGVLLLAWWVVPFALAVAYQPTWPLEDAVRPQRMWLLASQAGLILAAMGLVALVGVFAARRGSANAPSVRWAIPLCIAVVLVASLPTTAATARLMTFLWIEPRYAYLDFDRDHVPDMARLLDVRAPRPTVLSYEDWSSLVWYETGAAVVAVEPPGYAKLAFDPERFTGRSQTQRRTELAAALAGDVGVLVDTASRYGAGRILLARRDGAIGLIGQPASLAAASGRVYGPAAIIDGNGWDALVLEPGSSVTLPVADVTGRIDLVLRAATDGVPGPDGLLPDGRLRVRVGGGPPVELSVPGLPAGELSVVATSIDRPPGAPIVIEAVERIVLQGVTGFVRDPGPPPGWTIATETPDAVVWRRVP
jgi:hypothetical protein